MENQRSFLVCKIVVFCLVVSFLAGFGGCGSNKSKNVLTGAVVGGMLGGGLGAIASTSAGATASTAGYVAVGTAAGAGLGAGLGAAATSDEEDANVATKSVVTKKKAASKK